jgi:hypothetical protein
MDHILSAACAIVTLCREGIGKQLAYPAFDVTENSMKRLAPGTQDGTNRNYYFQPIGATY